jgi:hypothetical protein
LVLGEPDGQGDLRLLKVTSPAQNNVLHPNQPHPVYDCLDLDLAQKVIAGELPQHLPLDPSAG